MGTMAWHKCDTCGKKFAFLKSLQEHQRCHEHASSGGTGPPTTPTHQVYRCENCNPHREFYYHSDYQQHLDSCHAKKFNCPLCKTPFADVDVLQAHMRVHANERALQQQELSLSAPPSQYVTPIPPAPPSEFRCSVCSRTFPTSAGCARHVTRKHPNVARRTTLRSGGAHAPNPPNPSSPPLNGFPPGTPVLDTEHGSAITNHLHYHQSDQHQQPEGEEVPDMGGNLPSEGAYTVKNFKLGKSLVISRTVIK